MLSRTPSPGAWWVSTERRTICNNNLNRITLNKFSTLRTCRRRSFLRVQLGVWRQQNPSISRAASRAILHSPCLHHPRLHKWNRTYLNLQFLRLLRKSSKHNKKMRVRLQSSHQQLARWTLRHSLFKSNWCSNKWWLWLSNSKCSHKWIVVSNKTWTSLACWQRWTNRAPCKNSWGNYKCNSPGYHKSKNRIQVRIQLKTSLA